MTVLRGNIDALFGLVPWLAAAALVGCLLVTVVRDRRARLAGA